MRISDWSSDVCSSDLDRPPALGSTRNGGEHELEHGLLAEGVADDLEPPALFEEQAFEQVRGARRSPMADRQTQVGDAGLEVVLEAGDSTRQLLLIVRHEAVSQAAGDDTADRMSTRLNSSHKCATRMQSP